MKTIVVFLFIMVDMLFGNFLIGVGGFDCYKTKTKKGDKFFIEDNSSSTLENNLSNKNLKQDSNITNNEKRWCAISEVLKKKSPNVNSVTIWITKDWDKNWFKAKDVNEYIVAKGYTPLFIFYWYRDDISKKFVLENKKAYFKALHNFVEYLKGVDGEKYVVLNPEFNQKDISSWKGFNSILIESIKKVKTVNDVKVGFCLGDFGNYDLINDSKEWALFNNSIDEAVKYSDFIAFQEMRALTRNKPHHMLNTPYRALEFSKYLYKTYHKPTFLAYSAISSDGYNGEEIQKEILRNYVDLMNNFQNDSNLIGWNFFHYFDMPKQTGYFNEAEKYFGVISKDGREKDSLKYLNKIQ